MTLQLQQQWRKDGEKSDQQASANPQDADSTKEHAGDPDRANH